MTEQLSRTQAVNEEVSIDYRNASLPVNDRVADLLSRMTVEEKVAQMLCIWVQKKNAFR